MTTKKISLISIFVFLIGGVFLFFGPKTAKAMASVTICENDPTRFCSGGEPYFLSANFLSSPAGFTHTYFNLSPYGNPSPRDTMINNYDDYGYNAMFIYTLNQGDYSGAEITPYQRDISDGIGGDFNEARISNWRSELEDLVNTGIRPVIWLFADDSKNIREASTNELERYITKMVESFYNLPIMWVLGLELDSYGWSQSKINDLGTHLKEKINEFSEVSQPVGVHQNPNNTNYMTANWVDFGVYQYGFKETWQSIYNETLTKKSAIGDKPFVAGEYYYASQSLSTASDKQLGLAAALAYAAGTGNGLPKTIKNPNNGEDINLVEFMENLPRGLNTKIEGNTIVLEGSGGKAEFDIRNKNNLILLSYDPFDEDTSGDENNGSSNNGNGSNNGSSASDPPECTTCPEGQGIGFVPCGNKCNNPDTKYINECDPCQLCHIFVVFDRIIDFLLAPCLSSSGACVSNGGFPIVLTIALIMLVIGGVMYFFSGGNPGTLATAKKLLTSVIIGLVIVYGAWLIVSLFFDVIGVADWTSLKGGWWSINCP